MKNLEIAKILNNIADILELKEVQWKPQAYRHAAQTVESLTEDIKEIFERGELKDLPGVGEHIAAKIEEIIQTGKLKFYEKLKKQTKIDIEAFHKIPFLGPKKIKLLYKKLKIKTVKELEQAIKKGKLRKLAGFAEKTEETLLEGIKFIKTQPKRFLYSTAIPIVNEIKEYLSKEKSVKKVKVAGSFRRGKETVGDLDFLVISKHPIKVMDAFVKIPDVKRVLAKGRTKSSLRLTSGMQVDLRVVQEKQFGSAMNYFIGSKAHNVGLRKYALSKGYTLSEYGLFKVTGKKWIAGKTEESIYKKLGMQFVEPELRENQGEIKAALAKKLPKLITFKDVKGVFHNHTKWSDAYHSILEMAQKAEELGLKFISFNDHYGKMGITHPLDEKRLKKYLKEIERVRKKVGIRVFSGVEIDILKDGKLPLSKKKLQELDVVAAAVHTSIRMQEKAMTERVCYALENYPVNILAHPTDRLLNERKGLNINMDKVAKCARDNNVFLEINSYQNRMDLSGEMIHKCHGNKFAISTDAHHKDSIQRYNLGVLMARRGWLEKKDVLNCWTLPRIEKALKKSSVN